MLSRTQPMAYTGLDSVRRAGSVQTVPGREPTSADLRGEALLALY